MRKITIFVTEESIMAHMPSGQVKFLTFIQFLKLAWFAMRHNVQIVIEESKP
jgi:hypothetical protein